MRTGLDPNIRVRIDGVEPSRSPLPEGATLDVKVMARSSDGTLRVRVAGKSLSAASVGPFEPGDAFAAKVRYSRGEVFLDPVKNPASVRAGVLARLSLPDTPTAAYLVRFFERSLYKLDAALCRSLLSLAARFPGRERRAVEAAAILETHGLLADEERVARLMDAIAGTQDADEPDPDGSRDSDSSRDSRGSHGSHGGSPDDTRDRDSDGTERMRIRDYVAFINHKKGHERHWIVVPFSRELGGRVVSGSIRCMIDLASGRCLETLMTANDGEREWDFDLSGSKCEFRANPPFTPVKNGEFALYLRDILASTGYTEVYPADFVEDFARDIPAIDLEV